MSHEHNNCTRPQGGAVCYDGVVFDMCDYEACDNIDCVPVGHCRCKCHSGKTCDCGNTWEKM